ncbi:MAG: DUF86 domain-containing protein [Planctomycetes bacterium]|nr:DUF86 domain-containing protein [Planctomycetota bacterium]
MRDDRERLLDIHDAIERINKYAVRGRDAFESDELVQTWIIHYLQILGEAAAKISGEFRENHPDLPWPKIIGMRNILIHGYFDIDVDIVWAVVQKDLPALQEKVKKLL